MSRDLYVSALDLARFQRVQGSGDERLLSDLLSRNAARLTRHDTYFRRYAPVTLYTPLAEALTQIVRGHIDPALTPRFQFEHAVALLADSLGEPLDAHLFAESAPAFLEEVDEVITRGLILCGEEALWPSLSEVLQRGPYLNVPLDPAWRLGCGWLSAEDVTRAAAVAQACTLEAATDALADLQWPDDALDAAGEYRDWLCRASSTGQGLFFHA